MLSHFLKIKDLFTEKVQLLVSDNCSTEDIISVCDSFISKGLPMAYYCNEINIGMDGNFINCFKHAEGKYVWLLGSDDIPVEGLVTRLISILESENYGLVHLSIKSQKRDFSVYNNHNEFLKIVGHWITFISGNIIQTSTLENIDLNVYKGTFISQVPAYLNACCSSSKNAILCLPKYFEDDDDSSNNGGYNIFEVFVKNLYGIYVEFVNNGLISKHVFNYIKRIEFRDFLVVYIINLLIFRRRSRFGLKGSWNILVKYYGFKPYAYFYLSVALLKRCVKSLVR
jgi:glycosyltransferase involved in cell wall biosynthesis